MPACPRCGAMNADGATACAACGSPLAAMAMPPPMAPAMGMGATAKHRPTGVTILSVLYFIGAAGLALLGVMFLAGGAFFSSMLAEVSGLAGSFVAALGVVIAFFMLIFAALAGLTGWGMWTGKSWAWVLALVLTGLNALSSVGSLLSRDWSAILGLAIAGFIIWYLLQPGVKAWFGRT